MLTSVDCFTHTCYKQEGKRDAVQLGTSTETATGLCKLFILLSCAMFSRFKGCDSCRTC